MGPFFLRGWLDIGPVFGYELAFEISPNGTHERPSGRI
jgi:hypothetical protein